MIHSRRGQANTGLPQYGVTVVDYRGSGVFLRPTGAELGSPGRIYLNLTTMNAWSAHGMTEWEGTFSRASGAEYGTVN